MTYQIENESDLIKALKECRDGDVIMGMTSFECFGTGNVCLKSVDFVDLNIHLRFRHYGKLEGIKPYLTTTKNCFIINLVIVGQIPTNPTTWDKDGLQHGLCIDGGTDVCIVNPTVDSMNYCGIMTDNCLVTQIHGGTFMNCATPLEKYGFGHPVFFSQRAGQSAFIFGGQFSNNKHHVASSYDENDVTLIGCRFIAGAYSKHQIDRHSRNGIGGRSFTVKFCEFVSPNNFAYDFAKHTGQVIFEGNTFARPFGMNGRIGGVMESEGIANYKNNVYA